MTAVVVPGQLQGSLAGKSMVNNGMPGDNVMVELCQDNSERLGIPTGQ